MIHLRWSPKSIEWSPNGKLCLRLGLSYIRLPSFPIRMSWIAEFLILTLNSAKFRRYHYFRNPGFRSVNTVESEFRSKKFTPCFQFYILGRTTDRVPDSVIEKMFSVLEPPNLLRNPWERFSFTLPVQDQDQDKVNFGEDGNNQINKVHLN